MSEFVQAISPGGVLLLPRPVVETLPAPDQALRDIELLTRTPEQIAELSDDEVIDGLAAVRRRKAETEAREARLLARLHELRGGDRYVPDEAALELRISVGAAAARVAHGVDLVRRMPQVLQALDDGEFDGYTAGKLTEVCRTLSDEAAREVDHRWGAKRAQGTLNLTDPAKTRRMVQRLALSVDPDAAVTRAKQARNERKVQLISGEDTMSRLIADLPAELAASAYGNVDRHARRLRNNGDERTLDQLRADVLGHLLTGNGSTGGGRSGAMVFLHMPITTALTMTEDGCELSGYGPIPGQVAREIMTHPPRCCGRCW